jgi:hypothetical protein
MLSGGFFVSGIHSGEAHAKHLSFTPSPRVKKLRPEKKKPYIDCESIRAWAGSLYLQEQKKPT